MKYVAILLPALLLPLQSATANELAVPPSLQPSPATETTTAPASEAPRIPDTEEDEAADSRNIPQPEVRIIHKKDSVIEEYRINGRLRFVKITPSSGPAYYMVDTDGDGILETRSDDLANPPINQWILLQW